MSATYDQRVFRWGAWYGAAERDGWTIIGYEHDCGAPTLVDFAGGYDGTCCSGCHFEIQRPATTCKPLYRPVLDEVAERERCAGEAHPPDR